MGLQSSIDITYNSEIDLENFINLLFNNNWHLNDNGNITYCIDDDFEWISCDLNNSKEIINLIAERFLNNQLAGIAVLYKNSTGCLLHFLPGKTRIMLLLNINRTTLPNSHFTDFTFYSKALNSILNDVFEINYSDVI